jgi:hypothetical protein
MVSLISVLRDETDPVEELVERIVAAVWAVSQARR